MILQAVRISNLPKQMQLWHLFSQIVFPFVNLVYCKIFTGSSVSASEPALVCNNWRQLYFSGTMRHIVVRIKLAQAWNEAFVLHGSLTMEKGNFRRNDSSAYTGISFCNHLQQWLRTRNHMLLKETRSRTEKPPNIQSNKLAIWLKLKKKGN